MAQHGMQFGVLFSFHSSSKWGTATTRELYGRTPEIASRLEASGLDSMFFSEHHLSPHGECPSPLIFATAAAAATDRLKVGSSVLLAPFYHPVKLAEDISVLDNISGGRVIVGIGMGYRAEEFAAFGIPMADRVTHFRELIEVVDRLLREEGVSYEGRLFSFEDVTIAPRPVQQPIPLWLGGQRRRAVHRIAELGHPLMLSPVPLPMSVRQREVYLEALAAFGRSADDVTQPVIREVFVGPTDKEARDTMLPYVLNLYRDDYARYTNFMVVETDGSWREVSSPSDAVFTSDVETLLRDRVIIGSPETVAAEIERHNRDLPADHWIMRMHLPGMPVDVALESAELFGREVVPRLNAAARTVEGGAA